MPEAIEKVFAAIAGNSNAVNFLEAISAPAVTDDASKGFSTSSVWFKKTTSQWYTCSDATAGAAVWDELTTGGGGGGFPSDGLIAVFHNPDETYDSENVLWSAANDGDLKIVGAGFGSSYDPQSTANNRLVFVELGVMKFNAALGAALSDLGDVTMIVCVKGDFTSCQVAFGDGDDSALILVATGGAGRRGGTTANDAEALFDTTLKVARGWVGSGTKLYMQSGGSSIAESDGSVGAGTTGTVYIASHSATGLIFGATTAAEVAFLAFYDKFLDEEEEWDAIRTLCSDNALYGCAGVTL